MDYLILTINPGSTSTKIALFKNEKEIFRETIRHPQEEIERFDGLLEQIPMRLQLVLDTLAKHGYSPSDLSVVMGRGGMLPPVKTGGYRVNQKMLDLIYGGQLSQHASNLGAVIAYKIAEPSGIPAYIYDAVSSNDFPEIAQITGMPEIRRTGFHHVLNSRAAGIRYAESIGKKHADLDLLVSHLGGGITIGAYRHGKLVDSLADDNGPFAPERAGSIPLLNVIDMCYSGQYSKTEMKAKVRGKGGLRALLGTSDGFEIENRVKAGDEQAIQAMTAQAYQIAKGVAMLSPALLGHIDAIILTGGLAHDQFLIGKTRAYIEFLAPIVVMPGEFELEALALGGLRIMREEESVNEL